MTIIVLGGREELDRSGMCAKGRYQQGMGVKLRTFLFTLVAVVALVFDFPSLLFFPETFHKPSLAAAPAKNVPPQKQPASVDPQKMAREFTELCKNASPGQWLLYQGNPVLVRSALWQWDDFKVGSPVVFKEGSGYRMWYRGCHFIGKEYTCGIGHATSKDGIFWVKSEEPVFVPEKDFDSKRLNTLAVVRAGNRYLMWYSVDADWIRNRPTAVYMATSADGLSWQKAGMVLEAISEGTMSIQHAAFYDGKRFHLWYVDIPASDGVKALVHVTSPDGNDWQVVGFTRLDTLGVDPGRIALRPDGNGGYRAIFTYPPREQHIRGLFSTLTSKDGNDWDRPDRGKSLVRDVLGREVFADSPVGIWEAGGLRIWFVLKPDDGGESIGVGFRREEKQ